MAKVDSGRHRNPGAPQDDGEGMLGPYWSSFKYKALSFISDEPPADTVPLTEMPLEHGYMEGFSEMTDLNYTQRITGFFMMMGMGTVLIILGMSMWVYPRKLSFFVTFGSLFCLCSTMFLAGCMQQLRTMFEANRFQAACLYVLSVFLTMFSALWLQSSILCIMSALAQFACILWYALSFVPYARQTMKMALTYASMFLGPLGNMAAKGINACVAAIFG